MSAKKAGYIALAVTLFVANTAAFAHDPMIWHIPAFAFDGLVLYWGLREPR